MAAKPKVGGQGDVSYRCFTGVYFASKEYVEIGTYGKVLIDVGVLVFEATSQTELAIRECAVTAVVGSLEEF